MSRIVEDLHGNIFEVIDSTLREVEKPQFRYETVIHEDEELILTKDLITGQTFNLARYGCKYGFMFYSNGLFYMGEFKLLGYKPKNDVRGKKNPILSNGKK